MAEAAQEAEFFVGYHAAVPPRLRNFLLLVIAIVVAAFALVALWVATGTQSPGDGLYAPGGGQVLTGIVQTQPYPVLRLAPAKDHPKPPPLPLAPNAKNAF